MITKLSEKGYLEVIPVSFNFVSELDAEIIVTATVTVTTFTGVDLNPAVLLKDAPLVVDGVVYQWVKSGKIGVAYLFVCKVTTSGGRTLTLSAILPVVISV